MSIPTWFTDLLDPTDTIEVSWLFDGVEEGRRRMGWAVRIFDGDRDLITQWVGPIEAPLTHPLLSSLIPWDKLAEGLGLTRQERLFPLMSDPLH